MFTHYFKLVVLIYEVKTVSSCKLNSLQLLTVFNFIDENDQLKVMCEHRDLLLCNSLQLLTVFNLSCKLLYNNRSRCSHITFSWSFSSIKLKTASSCKLLYNNRSRCSNITLSWSLSSIKLKKSK
jgi:hypothetical protein